MTGGPSWAIALLEDGADRALESPRAAWHQLTRRAQLEAVRLEKRPSEQFKPDFSCLPHVFFRRKEDGAMAPFLCGSWSCPTCAAARARTVRAGVYRSVRRFALVDMVTLTLPPGARGATPLEARVVLLRLFNALRTRLRKRGFFGSYLWVTEAHEGGECPEDVGMPHLHVAANLRALLAAAGNQEWAGAMIAEAWAELGGGFASVTFGRGDGRTAAAYLSKYLGKSQGVRAPWEDVRYCTKDGSYRTRPWHRFGCSRDVGRAMKEPERPTVGTWDMVRAADTGTPWELFAAAKGSGIVPECAEAGGHPLAAEWVPGSCHHDSVAGAEIGMCFCAPPWARDLYTDADAGHIWALKALDRYRRHAAALEEDKTEAQVKEWARDTFSDLRPWGWDG